MEISTPPLKIASLMQAKKTLVAAALISLFNSAYAIDNFIYRLGIDGYDSDKDRVLDLKTDSQIPNEYQNIDIRLSPTIENNRYTVAVDGKTLTVHGSTNIHLSAQMPLTGDGKPDFEDDSGSNALYAVNDDSVIDLRGDVSISTFHNVTPGTEGSETVGANAVYAKERAEIFLGNEGTKTSILALAQKPDAISAKNGGKVHLRSTNNQVIGSIDTLFLDFGTYGSSVSGTFSGSESFWFGDEQTFSNIQSINITMDLKPIINKDIILNMTLNGVDDIKKLLTGNYYGLGIDQWLNSEYSDRIKGLINSALSGLGVSEQQINEKLDLTFTNGAQWTYFGVKQTTEESRPIGDEPITATATATFTSTPKRISSITLNGGIINLFDENIQQTWGSIIYDGKSLLELWPELAKVNHDYVRIGDLKGSQGIFRLDLDAENKQNSDMVFIESSSTGGQHYIEPYNLERLESVSPTNTLTFALTHKNANQEGKAVTFTDKENFYGQHLFDYELEIDSREIQNAEQISDISYDSFKEDGWEFDPQEFVDGKEWFIKRVNLIESAASIGMRSAGYASYDLATSMDRRDRRLQNAVFQNNEKDGLWARVQYGEVGAEHLYDADLTTVYVGYEKATSADNRLGVSFAYTDGESDFSDLKGSGDLKRYEASIYDTLTFGSHYLDFVARFGQVDNEFDVTNQAGALSTSGSFDQKYAALSAEYGYNFKDEHNVFIEPQMQLQVAYLGDYDYRTERSMKVKADDDMSVIGRMGLRVGKAFEASNYAAELYARADVLHQFTDGQDAVFSDVSHKVDVNWGDKDTWSTFGVGGYFNWKDNISLQMDVEKTAGGETADTWIVSGRFNYLF